MLTLRPNGLLTANRNYTISVGGVRDTSNNSWRHVHEHVHDRLHAPTSSPRRSRRPIPEYDDTASA